MKVSPGARPRQSANASRIVVLATGGTIAGQQSASGGYCAGQLPGSELLRSAGLDGESMRVTVEDIASIGSQDMDHATWHRLAARILALAQAGAVDGVVITHGTDTLEETAFFLSRVLSVPFHVVLTGAMRPADAPDADGPINLRQALILAAQLPVDDKGRVLVAFGSAIHEAEWVKKVSASSLAAFASPDACPVGEFLGDHVYWKPGVAAPSGRCYSLPNHPASWPRVGIIHAHAGMDASLVEACMALNWDGWVLAGVGNGNAHRQCLDILAQAARRGVAVVRARRAQTGWVSYGAEIDDQAEGFIAAGRFDAQQSRILLMLALCETRQVEQLRQHFLPLDGS